MGIKHGVMRDKHLKIVPRRSWGAREPLYFDPLTKAVAEVVFTSTPDFKFPFDDKKAAYNVLREIQLFHIYQRYMPDIQYNFMIDEIGTIYEGRGWFAKPSYSPGDPNANLNSYYIGYVGEIAEDGPSDDMMKSGNDLIGFGMRHEYIKYHHHIKGLITGIVGTTLEECMSRKKRLPSDSEDGDIGLPVSPPVNPLDQFYGM